MINMWYGDSVKDCDGIIYYYCKGEYRGWFRKGDRLVGEYRVKSLEAIYEAV